MNRTQPDTSLPTNLRRRTRASPHLRPQNRRRNHGRRRRGRKFKSIRRPRRRVPARTSLPTDAAADRPTDRPALPASQTDTQHSYNKNALKRTLGTDIHLAGGRSDSFIRVFLLIYEAHTLLHVEIKAWLEQYRRTRTQYTPTSQVEEQLSSAQFALQVDAGAGRG